MKNKKEWQIVSNDMDCYYELVSPLKVIVRRYPTKAQAEEGLEVILEAVRRSSKNEEQEQKIDPV
tara:strand:+ start:32797 stop:32991 length:195 start_codon:yes stop_codon:yes gene_type:complete